SRKAATGTTISTTNGGQKRRNGGACTVIYGTWQRWCPTDSRYPNESMRPCEKEGCTWDRLKELIHEKYYPTYYRAEMERQFLSLKQGTRSVDEYEREFTRLAAFVLDLVRTEAQRAQRFIDGLYLVVRHNIVGNGTQTYARAVSIAQEVGASIRREANRDRSQPSAPVQSSTAPPALPAARRRKRRRGRGRVARLTGGPDRDSSMFH
ncbi:Unknown protein, partial [Striga hermonthica]